MRPIQQIMNIPDLLDEMDIHYYTRPIYELISMCSNIYNSIINIGFQLM